MSVETKTISAAMRELAQTIQCADGVANAACAQAAERLDAQDDEIAQLRQQLAEAEQCYDSWFALSDLISRLRYGEITAEQLLKECEKPLEKAPPAPVVPEWIDVNLLLPDNDTKVIGCCGDDVFECHHYTDGAFDACIGERVKVEYWQPMPDSPYQTGQVLSAAQEKAE